MNPTQILNNSQVAASVRSGYEGKRKVLVEDATLEDTLRELPGLIRQNMVHTAPVAAKLQGKDLETTCRRIFEFFNDRSRFGYQKDDPNREQIRTFPRLVHDGKGDCDCFVNSMSAMLLNLGIKHHLRITKYKKAQFEHIYIVVPRNQSDIAKDGPKGNYITLDRVAGFYDYEVPFTEKKDIVMVLEVLNGIEGAAPGPTVAFQPWAGSPNEVNIDAEELFGDIPRRIDQGAVNAFNGLGNTMSNKAAKSASDAGMTVEQWAAQNRAEFIRKHGITPEEYQRRTNQNVTDVRNANEQKQQSESERMRAELRRRGVNFPANASHSELIRLLNVNPAPSQGAQFINKVNKYNPATLALRAGVLLAMKSNLYKIASQLRYTYLTSSEAKRKGIDMQKYARLLRVKESVEKIYYGAGGNKAKLREAILSGRGNQDRFVPYNGSLGFVETPSLRKALGDSLYLGDGIIALELDEQSLNGLGEIATGVAMSAAAAALGAVAAIIKSIGDARKEGKSVLDTTADALQRASGGVRVLNNEIEKAKEAQAAQQEGGQENHRSEEEQEKQSNEDNDTESFFSKHAVPLVLSGTILFGGAIYAATRKSSAGLSGTPKAKKAKTSKNPAKSKSRGTQGKLKEARLM